MTTKLSLFAILFSMMTSIVYAQDVFQTPAHNNIDHSLVKDETYKMKWFAVKDTAKIEIGEVSTQISKKEKTLSVTTTVTMKNQPDWVDESVSEIKNFQPVKHTSYNMQRDIELNFAKTNVTGFYLDKADNNKITINETVKNDYFDSNLYPQLIRWMPLKQGYKTEISIFDYNPKTAIGVIKAYVLDTKQDKLNNIDVWVVTATDDISSKQAVSKYYIDMKTRDILKQEINIGPRKMLMERAK